MGAGYSIDGLISAVARKNALTAQTECIGTTKQKVNSLVDIQHKLQAGKGAGYKRWVKVFNLNQIARAMNYLMVEHRLTDYNELSQKSAAAMERFHTLFAHIKALEQRKKGERLH